MGRGGEVVFAGLLVGLAGRCNPDYPQCARDSSIAIINCVVVGKGINR